MKRIITDKRFNNSYEHTPGTAIVVTWTSGIVIEYKVGDEIYYTSISRFKKYSNDV